MQFVAKHLCYNQSFYNEKLSFLNDNENHLFPFFLIYTPTVGRKTSETDSVKSKISSMTCRGKKDSTKHHRHHQRQPGEQQFPMKVATASLTFDSYFYLFIIFIYNENSHK